MATDQKRTITPDDLYEFQHILPGQISPDGGHVIFPVQRTEKKTEKKYTNLWLVSTTGGPPYQFTYGNQVDTSPKWSPDGRAITFISNRHDEKQRQLYIIPFNGGEARPVTDMQGEFGDYQWSPDGKQLVCMFRQKDQAILEREEDEQKKELGVVERRITRLDYKLNGYGFLPQERWHLWLIEAETGTATPLTRGDTHDELYPTWSPSGEEIAFCANRTVNPDLEPDAVDLFIIPATGGEARRLETPFGTKNTPVFSPDGRWLAYYGREGAGDWRQHTNIWLVDLTTQAPTRSLTDAFDWGASALTSTDLNDLHLKPLIWSADSKTIYLQVAHQGDTILKAIHLSGDEPQTIIPGPGGIVPFNLSHTSQKLAYLSITLTDPGQVWLYDLEANQRQQLTDFNQPLLTTLALGQVETVWFKGPDDNDLQGWIIKPPNFDPTKTYPSILQIHGGPLTQYGHCFMHEFYYLAAQGYVVYYSNPRGGIGYGEMHARAIANNWGEQDYADLMAWADWMEQKPYIDPNRMGVAGGSYGGYMIIWIIGRTNRFRAAVPQRVVSNLISFYGSSDMNWQAQYLFGSFTTPWADTENYWRQSPLKSIGQATTPTLVIHSEQDLRCPIEQGEQLFVALKKLGVETEMVRFPDETHELSRSGRTDRRIARLKHMQRWFDRYLKDDNREVN